MSNQNKKADIKLNNQSILCMNSNHKEQNLPIENRSNSCGFEVTLFQRSGSSSDLEFFKNNGSSLHRNRENPLRKADRQATREQILEYQH